MRAVLFCDAAKLIDSTDEGANEEQIDECDEAGRVFGSRIQKECANCPSSSENRDDEEDQDIARCECACIVVDVDKPGQHAESWNQREDLEDAPKGEGEARKGHGEGLEEVFKRCVMRAKIVKRRRRRTVAVPERADTGGRSGVTSGRTQDTEPKNARERGLLFPATRNEVAGQSKLEGPWGDVKRWCAGSGNLLYSYFVHGWGVFKMAGEAGLGKRRGWTWLQKQKQPGMEQELGRRRGAKGDGGLIEFQSALQGVVQSVLAFGG